MRHSIVIVGGGPAGVSALIQIVNALVEKRHENTEITIIVVEKSDEVGPGLPFSTSESIHILNLSAEIMSPDPKKPTLFVDWLKENRDQWKSLYPNLDEKAEFHPRSLYGLFLKNIAKKTKDYALSQGIHVNFLTKSEVVDISRYKDRFVISIANDSSPITMVTNQILLCTGHLSSDPYRKFIGKSGYVHSPWPCTNYTKLTKHERNVVIIGSRLTAIDVALALKENGHNGKIYMLSRSGQLSRVLGPIEPYQKQVLTLENLNKITLQGLKSLTIEQLCELFWQEINIAEGKNIDELKERRTHQQIDILKKEIEESKNGPRAWQCMLMSLYPIVPDIWKLLDDRSKEDFLKNYYSIFLTYLAAFPIVNAEKILKLMSSGQLEIISGFKDAIYDEKNQHYLFYTDSGIIQSNYVINATGPGYFFIEKESSLFRNLSDKGFIRSNRFGGIDVEFNSLQIKDDKGNVLKNFFAAGEITRGVHLATTDLGQVSKHVERAVYVLIQNMNSSVLSLLFKHSTGQDHIKTCDSSSQQYSASL